MIRTDSVWGRFQSFPDRREVHGSKPQLVTRQSASVLFGKEAGGNQSANAEVQKYRSPHWLGNLSKWAAASVQRLRYPDFYKAIDYQNEIYRRLAEAQKFVGEKFFNGSDVDFQAQEKPTPETTVLRFFIADETWRGKVETLIRDLDVEAFTKSRQGQRLYWMDLATFRQQQEARKTNPDLTYKGFKVQVVVGENPLKMM